MPEESQRHRSERRRSPFLLFLKKYWVEILIVVGLILAVFLLFEQMNIRGTLLGWVGRGRQPRPELRSHVSSTACRASDLGSVYRN